MRRLLALPFLLLPTLTSAQSSLVDRVGAAESLWRQNAPAEYEFTLNVSEMILSDGCGEGRFSVRVVGIRPEHRGDCATLRKIYSTVPQLFRAIRDALTRPHTEVSAEFDPSLGYPTSVYVGDSVMVDAYFSLSISDFRALRSARAR